MTDRRPLRGCRVLVIGPGRVGASFGHWLLSLGAQVEIAGRRVSGTVADLTARGARWRPLENISVEPGVDLYLFAVADQAIGFVAESLAATGGVGLEDSSVALHVSGHHDAEALAPLRSAGLEVGTLHPLRAFTAVSFDQVDVEGTTFAVDGDPSALVMANRLGQLLGGQMIELSGDRRVLYHLAASLAAGGVVTILAAADRLRESAGLPPDLMTSYLHLTRGALDQLPPTGESVAKAITGPVARGDRAVIERQRLAVGRTAPELLPMLDRLFDITESLCRDAATSD